MKYRKRAFILLVAVILVFLLLKNYSGFHEDVLHLKNDKEFKIRPENSIESTISHKEKEVYDHIFRSDD
ncbi:hypothetical protein [Candidatus Wolbachia massiliensis]|uniref:Uncharacterized protein n=1 Tax=Candidatus Wolbachia massiliensis TaxID=1845000 RepID=A0A7M3U2Y7_9RICK|nr:hypothetical protein [Candidatus Wolbachia massiliensis]QOD38772.1 hypothetical protein ID128_02965 [Candidatus Wolbachia massiliensis]